MVSPSSFAAKLSPISPNHLSTPVMAAVCLVLSGRVDPTLLMIKRAEYPNDPWSGHMAFPGGRVESDDADALAAAIRECEEEIGLVLPQSACVGQLSSRQTFRKKSSRSMHVAAFVFHVDSIDALSANEEVAEIVEFPLAQLASDTHRTQFDLSLGGQMRNFPCVDIEHYRIWGLSLKFIDELIALTC